MTCFMRSLKQIRVTLCNSGAPMLVNSRTVTAASLCWSYNRTHWLVSDRQRVLQLQGSENQVAPALAKLREKKDAEVTVEETCTLNPIFVSASIPSIAYNSVCLAASVVWSSAACTNEA